MVHPFDSILPEEMELASSLIIKAHPEEKISFKAIERSDPPKEQMKIYLAAEKAGKPVPHIPRVVYAYYVTASSSLTYKALVNASAGHIISDKAQAPGVVGPIQPDNTKFLTDMCLNNPEVKAELEKLKIPKGYVVMTDPWTYGTDSYSETRQLVQHYMYLAASDHPEANYYTHPLSISPVFDQITLELVEIQHLPLGEDDTRLPTAPWPQVPPVEYHPDLIPGYVPQEVKPLSFIQPEGASFTVKGSVIEWQKWRFRVATNWREGATLYDVSFDGRDVFYRMALSEMTVPYGDPRAPYHRKQAFDLGSDGFGVCSNSLVPGADVIGAVALFDTLRAGAKGQAKRIPNTVAVYEKDNGLLMKHVNYRNEKAYVTRRRELVVNMIATVSNYEYIVEFIFDQAGGIEAQVRATGILSTTPINADTVVPFGTLVAPNVLAPYHQHLLSFRFDAAVDGHENTVVYDDAVPMPYDPVLNPHQVGYVTERTYVETAGFIDQAPAKARSVKVINENKINPISKKPVGYKVKLGASQGALADPSSFNTRRAHYSTKQFWVTKYHDDQLYAAGEFTNQSKDDTGLAIWAHNGEKVRNDDVVLWVTLGFTHVPRVEDFPVMPVEMHKIEITPVGFFEKNPALDVPQSNPKFNKSVLVNSATNGDVAAAGCCSTKI